MFLSRAIMLSSLFVAVRGEQDQGQRSQISWNSKTAAIDCLHIKAVEAYVLIFQSLLQI